MPPIQWGPVADVTLWYMHNSAEGYGLGTCQFALFLMESPLRSDIEFGAGQRKIVPRPAAMANGGWVCVGDV